MKFKLFSSLSSLEGTELIMLIAAIAVFAGLFAFAIISSKKNQAPDLAQNKLRPLVYGALSLTLSFILSYFKLFSMPFGGSITLCSMLPICAYAFMYGPVNGLVAGLAYSILQIIQGAYIVHPVQFVLDYFLAFTILGTAGFFKKSLPLGMLVAGMLRLLVSAVSGAVFFAEYAADYGFTNAWLYSFSYQGLTIGIDTVICVAVSLLPPVKHMLERIKKA